MLSDVREKEGEERSKEFISHVFSLLAVAVFAVSVLGVICAPLIIWVIATGFAENL